MDGSGVKLPEYKRPEPEEVIGEIGYEARNNAMAGELQERINDSIGRFGDDLRALRMNFLLTTALFVEDTMKANPDADKDALLRLAANEAQWAHTWLVRGLKRRLGEEIIPARMALVAYDIANLIGAMKWEGTIGEQVFPNDGKSLRDLVDEMIRESKAPAEAPAP